PRPADPDHHGAPGHRRRRQRALLTSGRSANIAAAGAAAMENGDYCMVTQVIGSTLDAQFAEDELPGIYNALRIEIDRKILGEQSHETLWCEVAQHLGGGRVRAVALGSTDGVQRGAQALDTGQAITVP